MKCNVLVQVDFLDSVMHPVVRRLLKLFNPARRPEILTRRGNRCSPPPDPECRKCACRICWEGHSAQTSAAGPDWPRNGAHRQPDPFPRSWLLQSHPLWWSHRQPESCPCKPSGWVRETPSTPCPRSHWPLAPRSGRTESSTSSPMPYSDFRWDRMPKSPIYRKPNLVEKKSPYPYSLTDLKTLYQLFNRHHKDKFHILQVSMNQTLSEFRFRSPKRDAISACLSW